jgi:alpha-mannosidase
MKEHYPQLYQRIKEKVAEHRWEVQGGMWVEADTNVSGGEALIRQFLYGKRFFREEFGIDV